MHGGRTVASGLRHHRFATLVQSNLLQRHQKRWCANNLNRQSVREDVDRVHEVIDQKLTLGGTRFLPELVEIEVSEQC